MSRADTHAREATALRDRLRDEGRAHDVEVMSAILRSLSTARATMSVLHRDNMALRRANEAVMARQKRFEEFSK